MWLNRELRELTWANGKLGTETNYRWYNMINGIVEMFIRGCEYRYGRGC